MADMTLEEIEAELAKKHNRSLRDAALIGLRVLENQRGRNEIPDDVADILAIDREVGEESLKSWEGWFSAVAGIYREHTVRKIFAQARVGGRTAEQVNARVNKIVAAKLRELAILVE